jgi:phosphatidylserine decarboxylase
MFLISFYWATAIFGLGFLFVTWFFRDPERRIPNEPNVIVSPADGKITEIVTENEPINGKLCKRVTIFLSVFNVHVNRVPIEGTIEDIRYNPGKFLAAFNPKASMDNEQNLILINNGRTHIFVKQIAGLIARRIVCWPKKGDYYESGQRYGLIRFGSRVDILLPENTKLSVACGDKVSGGKSIIGYLNSN